MNPQPNNRTSARPSHFFATPVVREQPRPAVNGLASSAW
jgi:hypothetical protein